MDPRVNAFLKLIGWSEGCSTSPITQNDGYDIIVSGIDGRHSFTDYSCHPFEHGRPSIIVNHQGLRSSASGKYQVELHWWLAYQTELNLLDFTPASQDLYALEILKERKVVDLIIAGSIRAAIERCDNEWASFPGNDYGQGGQTMPNLLAQYQKFLEA